MIIDDIPRTIGVWWLAIWPVPAMTLSLLLEYISDVRGSSWGSARWDTQRHLARNGLTLPKHNVHNYGHGSILPTTSCPLNKPHGMHIPERESSLWVVPGLLETWCWQACQATIAVVLPGLFPVCLVSLWGEPPGGCGQHWCQRQAPVVLACG